MTGRTGREHNKLTPDKQKLVDGILASSWDDTGGWRKCKFMNTLGICLRKGHKRHLRRKDIWYYKNVGPTKVAKRK